MKKLLALMLAAALALSLVACGGGGTGDNSTPSTGNGDTASTETPGPEETVPPTNDDADEPGGEPEETDVPGEDAYTPNFVIDGVYYSETDIIDPSTMGITPERYLEVNPGHREEALNDNSEIWVFVFASLHSLEDRQGDTLLPESVYNSFLGGNALPLELRIEGESLLYSTSYEFNDKDKKLRQFWTAYKSGLTLDDDYILYDGSNDCVKIVGLFHMKYHDYRAAIDENKELILQWGSYQTTYDGSNIVKEIDLVSISQDLQEKGLL